MDWAANYYKAELDAQIGPADYDPLASAEAHLTLVLRFNRILAAVRPGAHPDGSLPVIRRIRTAYWDTYKCWRQHDSKMRRGWDIPDWEDIQAVEAAKSPAKNWSVEEWLRGDRFAAQRAFSTQLSVFRDRTADMKRSERRIYNTTATLYVFECQRLNWALDPDRD